MLWLYDTKHPFGFFSNLLTPDIPYLGPGNLLIIPFGNLISKTLMAETIFIPAIFPTIPANNPDILSNSDKEILKILTLHYSENRKQLFPLRIAFFPGVFNFICHTLEFSLLYSCN